MYDAVNLTMLTLCQCHYATSVYDAARRQCCHRGNAVIVNAITLQRVYDAVNVTMLTLRQCHYAQSVYDAARRHCCHRDNADIVNAITSHACMMLSLWQC